MSETKIIRLTVPYLKKDIFKEKYGRQFAWNPDGKYWYWRGNSPVPEDLQPFIHPAWQEQPAGVGPRLTIELVPRSCWLSNVRSHVSPEQWDTIRKDTFQAANYTCEICGGKGDRWPVECHEIFTYDETTRTQKLAVFQALCPACHLVKHFGLAQIKNREDEALEQLCRVNGWKRGEARKYVDEQFDLWQKRSRLKWNIDLSHLANRFGIHVKTESATDRHDHAESFYREKLAEHRQAHPAHSLWEELTTDDGFIAGSDEPVASIPPVIPPPPPPTKSQPSFLKRAFGFIFSKRGG